MIKASKAILINREKILLQLRDNKPNIPSPNHWAFFGGEIDKGELPLDAIRRELEEELTINVLRIMPVGYYTWKNHYVYMFKGNTNTREEDILLFEGQKAKYFSLDEIADLKMVPPEKEFLLANQYKLF